VGIIIRQSLKSTIISYAGVALGALNTLILFPRFFEPEQFGLTRVLLSVATVLAVFAEFGGTNVINKYFPIFREERGTLKNFVFWILLKALAAYAIVGFIFYVFKDSILHGYVKNQSDLVIDFYGYIFPLTLFVLIFNLLEAYARSLLRIVFPTLLREVYLRVFLLAIMLLFHFDVISFELFMILFAASYASAMIVLAGYIAWLDRNFIEVNLAFVRHKMVKEVFIYGMYSILTVAVWKIVTQLDVIMLSYMDTLGNVAVYSIAFYIVTLIMLPQRFLHQMATPIVSNAIQQNRWDEVRMLYQRVALNQFAIGMFLSIGIGVNMDNLYHFLPEKYHVISGVVLVLIIGRLFDMATSINGEIILYSKFFRFNLFAGIGLFAMCIVTNYLFIPKYGILGAAIGTSISLTIFNVLRTSFVYFKFGFLPFGSGMIKALIIGFATLAVALVIPDMPNVYLNILIKSGVVVALFPALIYSLKVSDDINQFFLKAVEKAKVQFGSRN